MAHNNKKCNSSSSEGTLLVVWFFSDTRILVHFFAPVDGRSLQQQALDET
jgi:hypothetical protein